jgi:hypothetical protein
VAKTETRNQKLEIGGEKFEIGKEKRWVGINSGCGNAGRLGDFAGGFFEEFVDEGLVGFGLPGGHAAETAEELRGDANGDELLGVSRSGAADSAGAAEFGIG